MQLTFTHFFRPRWQHPKPGIRRKAVGRLKPEHPSDQEILQQLARLDQDVEVRCSALEKLVRPDLLKEIAKMDPTPQVRREAIHRLCLLLCKPGPENLSAEVRAAHLDQIDDPDILVHITLNADHPEIQLSAVKRISLETSLQQVVISSDNFQVRRIAASGVHSPELLDQLIKHCGRSDKVVSRLLREQRESQKKQAKQLLEQQQSCESLCLSVEKLAKEAPNHQYAVRFNALLNNWKDYTADVKQPWQQRFSSAQLQCETQVAQRQQQQQLAAQQQQTQDLRQQLLDDTLQQLAGYRQALPSFIELQQQHQALDQRWLELELQHKAQDPQQALFEKQRQDYEALLTGFERFQNHEAQLQSLLKQQSASKALDKAHSAIDWPSSYPLPILLQQAVEALSRQQQQKKQQAADLSEKKQHLSASLDQLEQMLDQGQLQQVSEQLKQVKSQSDRLKSQFRGSLKQRYQTLYARYQELNNWQQFATHPKLEMLCEEMESLLHTELDVQQRTEAIKELQQRWKALEAKNVPQSLHNRFQQANKAAYAPCQTHYEQQRELRQQNFKQRQQLLDQLQLKFDAFNAQQCDLKDLALMNREARQLWRNFVPVDRAPGKKLQQQFNTLLANIDTRLNADQEKNAAAKSALLVQAQALLEQLEQTDLNELLEQAKQLQQQWRNVGAARRKQEQELWQDFRAICNQLFEQRKVQQLLAESQTDKLRKKEPKADKDWPLLERRHQLCEALEMQLLTDGKLVIDSAQLESWNRGDFPAAPYDQQLQQRFELINELAHTPEATDGLLQEAEKQLRLLCIRLEILAGVSSPAEDQTLRMEYQLNHLTKALQQRQDGPSAAEVAKVKKLWLCTPFNQCLQELTERFARQLQQFDAQQ